MQGNACINGWLAISKIAASLYLLSVAHAGDQPPQHIQIPLVGPSVEIVVDGEFDESAWADATTIALGPDDDINLISLPDTLAIAISANGPSARYVDVYSRVDRQTTLNLHASMQMGMRTMLGDEWTDEEPAWQWGESDQWRSNIVRTRKDANNNAPFEAQILAMDGYEFVVSKALIGDGP